MIPKIIHYCWFGPGFMPRKHVELIRQWKRLMPDWTFMCWNESNFDVNMCEYTKLAYEAKKYAFVSDVARLYALSLYGGIYLDTDVKLYQSLDNFRNHKFFSAIEVFSAFQGQGAGHLDDDFIPKDININVPCFGLLSAVIGAQKDSQIIHESLAYYGVLSERKLRMGMKSARGGVFEVVDGVIARMAVGYGFKYIDENQKLEDDGYIYKTGTFGYACAVNSNFSVAYHQSLNSWVEKSKEEQKRDILERYYLLGIYDWYKKQRRRVVRIIKKILKI